MTAFAGLGGEFAALFGAFLWAVASVFYGRLGKRIPPLHLNLAKGLLALVMLFLTLLATGGSLRATPPLALGLLLLSGAIGVGFGDTVFFRSLGYLGARRALLLGILSPPMAGLMAWVLLDEVLSASAWLGILVTVAGVAWVVTERVPDEQGARSLRWRGIGLGLLAALAQSTGAILSHAALTQTDIDPLWSAFLRLSAGTLVIVLWLAAVGQPLGRWWRTAASDRLWPRLLTAVFLGTYLAMWLQQIALKLAPAGIAQTLLSTSPIFVLPLVIWSGEKVSLRAAMGALVALVGIGMLFILA